MTIVQQPDQLSLTGNINDFIIESADQVSFSLSVDGATIVDEIYVPNANNEIHISLTDILNAELSLTKPGLSWITEQPIIAKVFTAFINDQTVEFTALRGGIDNENVDMFLYLRRHFLTGQPQKKKISRQQPEFLSYYALEGGVLKIEANGITKDIATLTIGNIYLFNISYDQVKYLTGSDPDSFSVWAELPGQTTTVVQQYEYENKKGEDEEYFVWENSLGGLDVARFTGQSTFNPKQVHNTGIFNKQSKEYRTDVTKLTTKNTGHKQRDESAWIYDFLMCKERYKYVEASLRSIVLDESTLQYASHDYITSYEFKYRFGNAKPYLVLGAGEQSSLKIFWKHYYCQLVEQSFFFTVHMGDLSGRLSGQVELTISKPDESTYQMVKPFKGFSDVKFAIPVEETIVGINVTADGSIDTDSIKVMASLRSGREKSLPDERKTLPVTYDVGSVAITKDNSSMLYITINQLVTDELSD